MKILAVSDLHINRPFGWKGGRKQFTRFGNSFAEKLLNKIAEADQIILNGDIFDTEKPVEKFFALGLPWWDEKRYDPKEFLKELLEKFPDKTFVYVYGNHDGGDSKTEYFRGVVEDLSFGYENFTGTDVYTIAGNLFIHGHQFIDYIHAPEFGVKSSYHVVDQAVRIQAHKEIATALVGYPAIDEFIHSSDRDRVNIFFGHTHKQFVESIDLNGKEIYVQNLGCTLPGRGTNFAMIELGDEYELKEVKIINGNSIGR